MLTVRQAEAHEAQWLQQSFDTVMGYTKSKGYFSKILAMQANHEVMLLVACEGDVFLGHMKIVWRPHYPYYRDNSIPEIQDLNVRPDYRRQGIATLLLDEAEKRIAEQSDKVGIGFGLTPDYGAAQRMYVQRGYVPDGLGVAYEDNIVAHGTQVIVDDALVLHLVKDLEATA
jgi:GNAT superfamily N-acetyltransferase